MPTYIRLTDYKSSDKKEQEFFNPENRYEAKQEDFSKIPGAPIAYWVSKKVLDSFTDKLVGMLGEPKKGMVTANNDKYLRLWFEVASLDTTFTMLDLDEAKKSNYKWFPYNKGGELRRWFGNQEYCVNWYKGGKSLYSESNFSDRNSSYSFQEGLTWTVVAGENFSVRYQNSGLMLDAAAGVIYNLHKKNQKIVLAIMNTKITTMLIKFISPTINCQVGEIAKLPIIFPKSDEIRQRIEALTQQNINISKEEWDSRETSWDFTKNELIKHKSDSKIETAYSNYCNYWKEKFNTLHQNEVELNRLFIDIYELQDELTPDVKLKDITILKNEAKIVDGELVFQADEIMKQFISYGVGVMFGRYSLDSDGLLIANMGQEMPTETTFEIDDDNVIPVLEDDYFTDDIASRFVAFVKTVFGEERLSENIQFIEDALGKSLRAYFVKGFYEDHIKRYKKRPIYWMAASPKKGFMSLMYMYRYTSDIFATVQNGYLREYMTKLEASRENAQREADDASNSATQRSRASKSVEKINKTLDEIIKFDRETLTTFAQSREEIDLDDGVKVNYCKFKEVLFPITGLCK